MSTHQYITSERMSCELLRLPSSALFRSMIAAGSRVFTRGQVISCTVQMTVYLLCSYNRLAAYSSLVVRAAFLCEAEFDECPITAFASAQPNQCPLCRLAFPWDISKSHKILKHIAMHILFDDALDNTTEPCGLCMRPLPLCAFFLRKGKGAGSALQIDGRVSRCPNFVGKLFYSAASTERTNSPCINVPVICPLCPSTSAAVWKYNMKTHLVHVHPCTNGNDFQKGYVISNSERVALKILWEKQASGPRRGPRRNAALNPLTISEMHSSCQAIL